MEIRRFQTSDAPKVAAFRKLFPGAGERLPVTAAYYQWKYGDNPFGEPEAWVAVDHDDIVATNCAIPKRMKVGGQTILVAELGDTFTHPQYQGRGLYTELSRRIFDSLRSRGIDFVYGVPNDIAFPLWTGKLGLEEPFVLHRRCRVLNVKRLLRVKTRPKFVAAIISPVVNAGLSLFNGFRALSSSGRVSLFPVDSFGPEIDDLWATVQKDRTVCIVKDRTYLVWRYLRNPQPYNLFVAEEKEKVVGILVLKIAFHDGIKVGYIVDFLSVKEKHVAQDLFLGAIDFFDRRGADIAMCWITKENYYFDIFTRIGFFSFPKKIHFVARNKVRDPERARQLFEGSAWVFNIGDSDNI